VFVWSQIWSRVDVTARGELEVLDFVHTLMRAPEPVGMGDYFQCATLLGNDHELLNCVKDEKKNNKITKQLAMIGKEERNSMAPFPDQNRVNVLFKKKVFFFVVFL
jgi:thiamine monophosphate kinase